MFVVLSKRFRYYDPNIEHLPSTICARCRQFFLKIEKGEKTNNDLPGAFAFFQKQSYKSDKMKSFVLLPYL